MYVSVFRRRYNNTKFCSFRYFFLKPKFVFCAKWMETIKTIKITIIILDVIPLNNADNSFTKDNATFLCLKLPKLWCAFNDMSWDWSVATIYFFSFLACGTLRVINGIIFSNFLEWSFLEWHFIPFYVHLLKNFRMLFKYSISVFSFLKLWYLKCYSWSNVRQFSNGFYVNFGLFIKIIMWW